MHVGRFVVGIALMVAAVFLQICLVKYKQNFKALMLEMVNKVLPDNVPGLPFDFSEYVDTASMLFQSSRFKFYHNIYMKIIYHVQI